LQEPGEDGRIEDFSFQNKKERKCQKRHHFQSIVLSLCNELRKLKRFFSFASTFCHFFGPSCKKPFCDWRNKFEGSSEEGEKKEKRHFFLTIYFTGTKDCRPV
jgi:hypothetical protein